MAVELPELEETYVELRLEKTYAELEQMPSGALVASSAMKEMRNCALMLMRSVIEIANLTDIVLVFAKMPRDAFVVSNALAAAGRTSHQKAWR